MPPTFSPKVDTLFDELNAGSRVDLDEQAVRVNVSHTPSRGKRDAPLAQEARRGAGLRFRRSHTGSDLTAGATPNHRRISDGKLRNRSPRGHIDRRKRVQWRRSRNPSNLSPWFSVDLGFLGNLPLQDSH